MDVYILLILIAVLAVAALIPVFTMRTRERDKLTKKSIDDIANAVEKLSREQEWYADQIITEIDTHIDQTREAIMATITAVSVAQPGKVSDEGIVDRVENTLKEIQSLAADLKDSAAPAPDVTNDARMWTLVNSLRSDATEAREALDRSQKRLRQLGDSLEDASRKLRALDRRVKQARRQERIQALPAPDGVEDEADSDEEEL